MTFTYLFFWEALKFNISRNCSTRYCYITLHFSLPLKSFPSPNNGLSKNIEKMIKSPGAELPGSFAKYSWCLIFKFCWNGIPQRHQKPSSKKQISQTYTQTLSENKILMSRIPAWATFEDRMIKSTLSENLPLARGYWKLLPLNICTNKTRRCLGLIGWRGSQVICFTFRSVWLFLLLFFKLLFSQWNNKLNQVTTLAALWRRESKFYLVLIFKPLTPMSETYWQ